ncbi:hypothetical protein V8C35DRAFT_281348 [Trichoderma chlorosporum]
MNPSSPPSDNSVDSGNDVSIADALWEFLHRRNTTHEAVDQLMRFLQDDPASSTPDTIIPGDNMQARLRLIEETRQNASNPGQRYQLNFLQLAYFSLIPASTLPDFRGRECYECIDIKDKEYWISFYIQILEDPMTIRRDLAEVNKCIVRDRSSCILTGAAYPEACHIIPFAVNSSGANAMFSQLCLTIPALMSDSYSMDRLHRLLTPQPGCSDKSWNMLSLSPTLHTWWKKCVFAFKCIAVNATDEENATVRLQFHWMPRNMVNPRAPAEPTERDIETMLITVPEPHGAILGDNHRVSGRPLETGQTFDISMTAEEAFKMKVMIDAQWVVVRLAAISGLARGWEDRNSLVDEMSWWTDAESDW